ncbi:MAG: hypothetical protein OXI43_02750 [Candidatus Poribacteria bacterium]|nr:hypothetical protein [Candidatus Poribacteria bacterium]
MRQEAVYAKALEHEILADYEEQQLLRETQAGDENARERLILANLRLVRFVVQQYENFELGISADDLMADGIVGLCTAISNYDLDFGTRLSTYATLAIHHAVARSSFLNGTIRLPEHVMAGEGETIPFLNPAEIPMKKRELKRRKRRHKTEPTDTHIQQLNLFESADTHDQ